MFIPNNWFDRWILRMMFKRLVRQGNQTSNIREIYSLFEQEVLKEFYVDNEATLQDFLKERARQK
jgi:hypothetical protein